MLVLANLEAHRHSGEGSRGSIDYSFRGTRVCKATFLFVHAVGPKRYKCVGHFVEHGVVSRRHGNTRRLPANAIPFAKTESVVAFITHFSTIHALPLPGLCQVSIVMRRHFCYHRICQSVMFTSNTALHAMKRERFL